MELLGQAVKHNKYGKGVITRILENKVTVCFAESQKLFLYPDAFPKYLTLKNTSIEEKIERLNEERLSTVEAHMKKEQKENDLRNRIYTMKIPLRSQAAFHISPESRKETEDLQIVKTGYYLSGNMKGKPRIPSNLQPNSAIILTECGDEQEDERYIFGIAMVDDHFWGNECTDGQVHFHKQHKLFFPSGSRIPFSKYFNQEAFPVQWGRTPFKYFQHQTMQEIIFDVCRLTAGTEQEKDAKNFYRYFCSVNRLSEILADTNLL